MLRYHDIKYGLLAVFCDILAGILIEGVFVNALALATDGLPLDRQRGVLGRYRPLLSELTFAELVALVRGKTSVDASSNRYRPAGHAFISGNPGISGNPRLGPHRNPPGQRPDDTWFGKKPPKTEAVEKPASLFASTSNAAPSLAKGAKGLAAAALNIVSDILFGGAAAARPSHGFTTIGGRPRRPEDNYG